MNREEKRILHGLYFYREMIGEEIPARGVELAWLATHSMSAGRNWRDPANNNNLHATDPNGGDYLAHRAAATAAGERALGYLEGGGYVTYTRQGEMFRVAVTAAGADRARKLDRVPGQLDVLYRDNKDGILSLLVVIVLSVITSLITSCLTQERRNEAGKSHGIGTQPSAVPAGSAPARHDSR
jgi:hypothetical protein